MMKLKDILFEGVITQVRNLDQKEQAIVSELLRAFLTASDLSFQISNAAEEKANQKLTVKQIATKAYLQNKKVFDKIIGENEFKFIGAGAYGVAFSLGNTILKMDTEDHDFSTSSRTKMAMKALGGVKKKEQKLGTAVPAIYDSGNFTLFGIPVFWVILEKFESSEIEKWKNLINKLISSVMLKFIPEKATKKEIEKAAEKIRKKFINELKKMEEELRLSSDWLEKFIQDIVKLYDQQSKFFGFDADFHAGNVGIRRVGAEGYLKFFD